MNNYSKLLGKDMRSCTIDIAEFLDKMENEYKILLDADIEVAQTQDEVSEYTRETCYKMKSNLELMHRLGLLNQSELVNMRNASDDIRMQKIKENSEKEE